jgi:hypothetical protein
MKYPDDFGFNGGIKATSGMCVLCREKLARQVIEAKQEWYGGEEQ